MATIKGYIAGLESRQWLPYSNPALDSEGYGTTYGQWYGAGSEYIKYSRHILCVSTTNVSGSHNVCSLPGEVYDGNFPLNNTLLYKQFNELTGLSGGQVGVTVYPSPDVGGLVKDNPQSKDTAPLLMSRAFSSRNQWNDIGVIVK